MALEKQIFMICPVRGITSQENRYILDYIAKKEAEGYKVHYPPRDTDQDDPIGLNICTQNRSAVRDSEEVDIYYNRASTGTVFDLGMTFMAEKPLVAINQEAVAKGSGLIPDFIAQYSENIERKTDSTYKILAKKREDIRKADVIEIKWENSHSSFFEFGMVFMAEKPIILENMLERTPKKSFENVLIELDMQYKRNLTSRKYNFI